MEPHTSTNDYPKTSDTLEPTELLSKTDAFAFPSDEELLDDYHSARWRETECRFDSSLHSGGARPDPRRIRVHFPTNENEELRFEHGEFLIDSLNNIEDTQGNNGKGGRLLVTNIRLIWFAHDNPKLNLSIGFRCIRNLIIHKTQSVLRGNTRALWVKARSHTFMKKKTKGWLRQASKKDAAEYETKTRKFQFIFTNVVEGSPRLFTTIQEVNRAYNSSRLYREVRLRTQISVNNQLTLLPDEEIVAIHPGVMSIHGEEAVVGTLMFTNTRICWIGETNELNNCSIPFHDISQLSVKNTKFGSLIVVETHRDEKGIKRIGFRISPQHKAMEMLSHLQTAQNYGALNPNYGVKFTHKPPDKFEPIMIADDDIEIVEGEVHDPFASYSGEEKQKDRNAIYSESLGLAIEELRTGVTLESLWLVQ